MVKAVVGEETQLKLVEDRLSQSLLPAQVGLIIGNLSSTLDRGFVFDLTPTPQNDAGEPACLLSETTSKDDKKKHSKSKSQPSDSSLVIDKDWVAEHARQVSRMLLGGMKVVGIYVWANDSAFKNSTVALYQTVKAVAGAAPFTESDSGERLIIHICYSPRRWTCRNCTVASSNITSTSLRPCDFKMGKVLNSLQSFKCIYNFSLRLPICREDACNAQTLSEILRQGILIHANELRSAKAVVDGNLVVNDESCTTDGLHDVELLLPFLNDDSAKACSQKDVVGLLVFKGSVFSFAYLNSKEPISQAVSEIKGDIIRSLQSRLDIICDEAGDDELPTDDGGKEESNGKPVSRLILHSLRKTFSLSFPRRVFVPWLAGTFICDYLQLSETLEVLKDHWVELMSMEAPSDYSTILEAEVEAPSALFKSFWDVSVAFHSGSWSSSENRGIDTKRSSQNPVKTSNFTIMAAFFFLVLSILVGFVLTINKP